MQPVVQRLQLWSCTRLSFFSPGIRQFCADLCLNPVELSNAPDGLQGDRTGLLFGYVVELASYVRPASRLHHTPALVERIEAGVAIGLNNALEVL